MYTYSDFPKVLPTQIQRYILVKYIAGMITVQCPCIPIITIIPTTITIVLNPNIIYTLENFNHPNDNTVDYLKKLRDF